MTCIVVGCMNKFIVLGHNFCCETKNHLPTITEWSVIYIESDRGWVWVLSSHEFINHSRINSEMTEGAFKSLLLRCRTWSSDASSLRCNRLGHHSLTWESVLMRTRSSCSWLFSSRMRWLPKSATNMSPLLSTDKYPGELTSVNICNTTPFTSTSLTYIHRQWTDCDGVKTELVLVQQLSIKLFTVMTKSPFFVSLQTNRV